MRAHLIYILIKNFLPYDIFYIIVFEPLLWKKYDA